MCGIFGIWHLDGRPVDIRAVRRGTWALRHRGPDDEGYLLVDTRSGRTVLCGGEQTAPQLALPELGQFEGEQFDLVLGFRRLSIIDLSPAGHQPMPYSRGRFWIVYNGEIYNYIELRADLESRGHTFRSGSDTEVILAAYAEWGRECLSRFNGMWAFALWDNLEKSLFVARDRFGVKPLFVHEGSGTFAFASEIKGLLSAGVARFSPSHMAVAGYIAQGHLPDHTHGETFFENVRSLPPAHYSAITKGHVATQRYWRLPNPARQENSKDAQERYRALFTDAVRLRLRADVPAGTCLSGGLDSSSIVAVAGQLMQSEHAVSLERLGDRQQTFSAVYSSEGPWNERRYIESVVSHTGAGANYVTPAAERLWSEIESVVWHQDEPFQSTSIFAQWCVMQSARERGVTVLLDGQGADEVLGGYRPFAVLIGEMVRKGRLRQAARAIRDIREVASQSPAALLARSAALQVPGTLLAQVRAPRLKSAVEASGLHPDLARSWLDAEQSGRDIYSNQRSLHTHLSHLLEHSLPDLLRYEDRNSMAFSIEARLPFLDYRIVEYVFGRAGEYRIREGWTKWLQRRAVDDLLPHEIAWRRDKVGFETPEVQWLREGQSRVLDILTGSPMEEYIDASAARKAVPDLLARGQTGLVWRWTNLALWLRNTDRVDRSVGC